jgi:PKHD-type hydroxylase
VLLRIPAVLSADEAARMRARLAAAPWKDGRITAGHQSALEKRNEQLPEDCSDARELGAAVLGALQKNALFFAAALPRRVYPPLFNRYAGGMDFGSHVDNAIRYHPPTGERFRTDLSATLFLAPPEDYDGGELVVEDTYGVQRVKLPAGDMILYPATSRHRVTPVTRGARIACFFWIESMVRDDAQRALLFDLDVSIQQLTRDAPGNAALLSLTACYHNLLRRWADA